MKKNSMLLAILLLSVTCFAQTKNIDVDNVRFDYRYRLTPETPLDPPNFTYWGRATVNSPIKGIDNEELAEKIFISGQNKAESESEANIVIIVRTGSVTTDAKVNTNTSTYKDKDGKEHTSYSYNCFSGCSLDGSFVIKWGSDILFENNLTRTRTWTSETFATYNDAAKYWNDNRMALMAGWQRDLSLAVANAASNYASDKFGFSVRLTGDLIKTMDEKKHDENLTMRANVVTLKRVLSAANANTPVNADSIAPLIEYFNSIKAKYTDPKLKADDRLRYIANFNLCAIYFMLDKPDMAIEYANQISAGDYNKKDGAKLIKKAEDLKIRIAKSGLKTRHFAPQNYLALLRGEELNDQPQAVNEDENSVIMEDTPESNE
ncbi:MAG: hypothetical protein FWF72_04185 [Paludibacter sp.]|nr:hypothetical protein [Paludibacter sp.]